MIFFHIPPQAKDVIRAISGADLSFSYGMDTVNYDMDVVA
jgi:hypothetical protein